MYDVVVGHDGTGHVIFVLDLEFTLGWLNVATGSSWPSLADTRMCLSVFNKS